MWDAVEREVVDILRALMRFDTTNPPGNETPAAQFVAQTLARQAGIETAVLEGVAGRGNAVARLRGTGQQPPLLLMAHLDVVPAMAAEWRHPPFAAEVADGYIWGRGAIDTKNATAIQMMTMLILARRGARLKRDLLLGAMADEEVGGGGAKFLAEEHPDWVRAEYAFNEGGGEAMVVGGRRFYAFQVAQKGGIALQMLGRGCAGHSSVPYAETAISRLAAAILKIKGRSLPHRVIDATQRFFEGMAREVPDAALAQALRDMLDPEKEPAAAQRLGLDDYSARMFSAMLHNICEPTMLNAGYKSNVMPAEARATLSTRGLPGVTREQLLGEVRAVVGDEVELVAGAFAPGLEHILPEDDPCLMAARGAVKRWDPAGVVLPYLSCGGTDAAYLAPVGTKVIGFTPMRPDPAGKLLELAHAKDERISVENLLFGTRVLLDTVCQLNGLPPLE